MGATPPLRRPSAQRTWAEQGSGGSPEPPGRLGSADLEGVQRNAGPRGCEHRVTGGPAPRPGAPGRSGSVHLSAPRYILSAVRDGLADARRLGAFLLCTPATWKGRPFMRGDLACYGEEGAVPGLHLSCWGTHWAVTGLEAPHLTLLCLRRRTPLSKWCLELRIQSYRLQRRGIWGLRGPGSLQNALDFPVQISHVQAFRAANRLCGCPADNIPGSLDQSWEKAEHSAVPFSGPAALARPF